MSGTRIGGLKAAATNKERHGDNFYGDIGRMGGLAGGMKGFAAATPQQRSEWGRKGGTASRKPRTDLA